MISIMAILIVSPVFLYFYFKPEVNSNLKISAFQQELFTDKIEYTEFTDSLKNRFGKHLLFITEDCEDANYVENSILTPLSLIDENALPKIIKIDTTNTKNLTVTQLKNNYGIETTPAFVYIEVMDKKIEVIDAIVYHEDAPFTQNELKTWLFENNLWDGPYDEK